MKDPALRIYYLECVSFFDMFSFAVSITEITNFRSLV